MEPDWHHAVVDEHADEISWIASCARSRELFGC